MTRRRAAAALLAAATTAALALPAQAPAAAPEPERLTLRLADLPGGYTAPPDEFGDVCGVAIGRTSPSAELSELLRGLDPSGCSVRFERQWPAPGMVAPVQVDSGAYVLADAAQADLLLSRARALAAMVLGLPRSSFVAHGPPPPLGDEAVLLRSATSRSAAVVWRSGSVLGIVAATGRGDVAALVEATARLASLQQARIAAPTPVTWQDYDGVEVALDDPALDVPVAWLGRTLAPRGRLPRLRLLETRPPDPAGARAGVGPTMYYGRRSALDATVSLTLLRPGALHARAVRRELARTGLDACTHTTRVVLPRGRATIWTPVPGCRDDDLPDWSQALVVLPDVVVNLYRQGCVDCAGATTRYWSVAGLRRIARALTFRVSAP